MKRQMTKRARKWQFKAIFRLYEQEYSVADIAAIFGYTRQNVNNLLKKRKHE